VNSEFIRPSFSPDRASGRRGALDAPDPPPVESRRETPMNRLTRCSVPPSAALPGGLAWAMVATAVLCGISMGAPTSTAASPIADTVRQRSRHRVITIPTLDVAGERQRQVVVESVPGQYLGHPTTVLLADGRTILATYPLGHGGPAAVLKKSTDGGLTWSDRLPVPDNWRTATNCPCLHRLIGPNGVERLFVIEGIGAMRQSMSLDNGRTWTPFMPNGLHCVVAPITVVAIRNGRYLALYQRGNQDRDASPQTLWQSVSSDGGVTWGPERQITPAVEGADLCEPGVIRSPDGRQLAALIRENRGKYNSLLITSDDEGRTWSPPAELPASLTGHRHMPRYARDGRLVITFRDTAPTSPTRGEFVAWVGTYDDVVRDGEGRYRVRLLTSPKKWDLGYSGLERLPDDTFVTTTYAVLNAGEQNSVISIRFALEELDRRLQACPLPAR
jgi:hypothetical protein